MANKIELGAIPAKSSIGVPFVARDALHLGLRHCAVVVILAIRATTTTSFFLVHLHGLAKFHPIDLVGSWLVAWLFRSKHPIVDDGLGVLLVFCRGDELIHHWQARKPFGDNHKLVHAVFSFRRFHGQRLGWPNVRRGP